jgi:hypothetical protein
MKEPHSTHWTLGLVDPIADPDISEKKLISYLCQELNQGFMIGQTVD